MEWKGQERGHHPPACRAPCTVRPEEARGAGQRTLPILLILPTATCPLAHHRKVEEKRQYDGDGWGREPLNCEVKGTQRVL